jgi:hypothetical protein
VTLGLVARCVYIELKGWCIVRHGRSPLDGRGPIDKRGAMLLRGFDGGERQSGGRSFRR